MQQSHKTKDTNINDQAKDSEIKLHISEYTRRHKHLNIVTNNAKILTYEESKN